MKNPFHTRGLRRQWDAMVKAYGDRHKDLFRPNGSPHNGNGPAGFFWRGYDGKLELARWDHPSRQTYAYACWRAGRDIRRCEGSN